MSATRPSYHLVEVVHVLPARGEDARRVGTGDQAHQIEEVAALLDERAACVGGEAVPVADLGQEREAVLADRHHAGRAGHAARQLRQQLGDRRDEAVLQPDPRHRLTIVGAPLHVQAIGHGGAHRLLDQHGQIGGQDVGQDRCVGVVGRHDDDRVEVVAGQQLAVVGVGVDRAADRCQTGIDRRCDGIGKRHDLGFVDVGQVVDVLDPHHPGADDAVPKGSGGHDRIVPRNAREQA